MAGKILNNGS
jgi:hypothetical protein